MGNVLHCKDIALGYDGDTVVSGLNFNISDGDYLSVIGENGSGKSTLIKTILGLIKPVSGMMIKPADMKTGDIGYLPQQTAVQKDFPASVREIVLSGCLAKCGLRPFYNRQERELASQMMKRLGIEELSARCYRELSGGQQQRVLLARALCAAQKILLLDEPVTGLDPKAQSEMYSLITELNRSGVTVITVTHDLSAAINYSSHILHIGSHRQLFFGTVGEYRESGIGRLFTEGAVENDG